MTDFVTAAKAFHRQPTMATKDFSKSDKKQASEKLREATGKGETLNEWFKKKKSGKDCDAVPTPLPDGDLIPINDEWSEEARKKAAEARKKGGNSLSKENERDPKISNSLASYRDRIYQARTKQLRSK